MELLLVAAAVAVFALLVMNTKAKGSVTTRSLLQNGRVISCRLKKLQMRQRRHYPSELLPARLFGR